MIKWNEVTWYSKALSVLVLLLSIVWIYYLFTQYEQIQKLPNTLPTVIHTGSRTNTEAISTSTMPLVPDSPKPPPASVMSSSTPEQVGAFTVVIICKQPDHLVSAEILKNGIVLQTIGFEGGGITSSNTCLPAESQDINFDGYPDFMVADDDGTGGTAYAYWLYSTSTGQFSCPTTHGCNLMNPTFNPATKTITTWDALSAGSTEIETYHVVNGELILVSATTTGY